MRETSVEDVMWSSDVGLIGTLIDKSGESREFFATFTAHISKVQSLVSLLSEFSGVTVENGSLVIRFRDRVLKQMQRLRIETKELLRMIRDHRDSILNPFHQLGEWV